MTWFDILLVTLWSMVAALGWQLGLAGLLWALGVILVALGLQNLPLGPLTTALLALVLGALIAAALYKGYRKRWKTYGPASPLAGAAGLLGGLMLGGVLCAALALAFPFSLRIDAAGKHYQYPSGALPTPIQRAVGGSALVRALTPLWQSKSPVSKLLIPDSANRFGP